MKTLILSFLFIIGLAAPNIGKPINDIYSIQDQVITEGNTINDIPGGTYEVAFKSAPDSTVVLQEDKAYANDIPFDSGDIACKNLPHMKMKTLNEAVISDLPLDAEKVFYEKLEARLAEQYRTKAITNDMLDETENDFCCFEIRVPRSLSALMNSTLKESVRQ